VLKLRYDLHVHTTASDGVNSPEEVILMAYKAGLAGLAITDHDNVDGLERGMRFIVEKRLPIDFIPGVELNTDGGRDEVHILGYYIDFQDPTLRQRLQDISRERHLRAGKIVDKLIDLGIDMNLNQVQRFAHGNLIGRPHIARAICDKGYVSTEEEAFEQYIGRGRPAYVPRYKFPPDEAIGLIRKSGGVAILAHPGLIKDATIIAALLDLGLDGLEVYYPQHSAEQIASLIELAHSRDLLITGGSDYHGSGEASGRSQLGAAGIDEIRMARIKAFQKSNL
jgi:3',5'-nucleoside bisphosphate phosphatase